MGSNSNSARCHEAWHMVVRADSCALARCWKGREGTLPFG